MAKNTKWVALLGLLALFAVFFLIHLPLSADYSRAPKLLSHGIGDLICHGEQLFNPAIELFAGSEARLALCQHPRPSEPRRTGPLAPALYVFGDSLSDSGNNNFLQTLARVNYTPYGIDFPFGVTGRFTNGKTYVDFLAEYLGLPYAPPYLGLSAKDKNRTTTGVNYASGTAGILPETGKAGGDNLGLEKQIQYFQDTVLNDLFWIYNPFSYLSKSIFAISIGSNDYLNNYLQPVYYSSSQQYTPEQFANLLVDEIQKSLTKLYVLGARKFLVHNIGRIGCVPGIVNGDGGNRTTPCVEDVNNLAALYNSKLSSMINILESLLIGSTFVRGDAAFADPPSVYNGTLVTKIPCCGVDANGLCLPDQPPCSDRGAYRFWDAFHATEDIYRLIADDCFRGNQSCTPINVLQLAQK